MSYIPIDFVDDVEPYLEANNMNHMQQGIILGVDRSRVLDEAWKDGSLKGEKGDQGIQGEHGVDGVFDIDAITSTQLKQLHGKLTPLNNDQQWKYKTVIANGKTARINVADLNLILRISRVSATVINYHFFPINNTKPSTYYVNRLSNYDLVAWESSVTTGWVAQPITSSGFVLDASGYLPGREHTDIEVIDPNNDAWYSIRMIGLGEGTIFIDVVKRAVHNREVIEAI